MEPLCVRCKQRPCAPKRKRCAVCLDKAKDYNRKWLNNHPDYKPTKRKNRNAWMKSEAGLAYRANRRNDVRRRVFEHYGLSCACCGEDTFLFLTIDHVEGGGCIHRKSLKCTFYEYLIKANFPPGYQTLCWNCQHGKRMGFCPEQHRTNC